MVGLHTLPDHQILFLFLKSPDLISNRLFYTLYTIFKKKSAKMLFIRHKKAKNKTWTICFSTWEDHNVGKYKETDQQKPWSEP